MPIDDVLAKLERSLENMVTLEIVTAVGTVQPSTRDQNGARNELSMDPAAKILRTRVDLLQGDITTEMDPAFVTGDYREFRAFHAEREKQAVEMVKSNIEVVKALLSLIQSRSDEVPGALR